MSFVDIAIVVILLVSVLIGLFRGFIREILSLISWIVAVWVAFVFAPEGAAYLEPYVSQPPLRVAGAFAGIFVVVLIAASIISYLLYRLLTIAGIGGIDRSLGLLFGFVRGIIVIAILILASIFMDFTTQPWWKTSILVQHFDPVVDFIRNLLPADVAQYFIENVNEIDAKYGGLAV